MMLYVLVVFGAMVLGAEAGDNQLQFSVTVQNPRRRDALDRFRCCWGKYRVKLITANDDLDWVTIATQPTYGPHKRFYRATYTVDLEGKGHKINEPLVGFVLQYGRMQGERVVNNHMLNGFWGIIQMTVWPMDSENPKSQPSCTFATNQTYGANRYVVVCLYKRNEVDARVWQRVQKDYLNATYFKSMRLIGTTKKLMTGAEGVSMSGISGSGEWRMVYFPPQNPVPILPIHTPIRQGCCITVVPNCTTCTCARPWTLIVSAFINTPSGVLGHYCIQLPGSVRVVPNCTTCTCARPWNLTIEALAQFHGSKNVTLGYIQLPGSVMCVDNM